MKTIRRIPIVHLLILGTGISVYGQGTAFTYQGRLTDNGVPANGTYDLRFTAYDSSSESRAVGGPLTNSAVNLSNGLFAVTLDFGSGVFTGPPRWLEIGVRTNGSSGSFATLSPRQPLTPTPYALYTHSAGVAAIATNATTAASIPWSGVTGRPAGLDDGDNDTTYAAGAGLNLNGTSFSIAPGGIGTSQLADNAVTTPKLLDTSVTLSKLNSAGATAGQAIVYSGAALVWSNVAWSSLSGVPAGFADGVDDGTTYTAGAGLTLSGSQFSVNFGGSGSAAAAARSDHTHPPGDATTLDGLDSTAFATATHSHSGADIVSGTIAEPRIDSAIARDSEILPSVRAGDGAGSGLDADLFDGLDSTAFASTTHNHDTNYWKLGGNAGTTAGMHFIGTTDNQPFEFKVGTFRALRLEPRGTQVPNVIGGSSQNDTTPTAIGVTISGGGPNVVGANFGTVGGGAQNNSAANHATVGGGRLNTSSGIAATVGGGQGNASSGAHATVGGGDGNTSSGNGATVGGGMQNMATLDLATVGGGQQNTSSGPVATIAGGRQNTSSRIASTVGGGDQNTSSADWATVAGGFRNACSAQGLATIGGGGQNASGGFAATVPGGEFNAAEGNHTFAAGRRAKAMHHGSFIWADVTEADFTSTADNQFLVRATGGVGIGTGSPQGALHVYSTANPAVIRLQSPGTPGAARIEFVSDPQGSASEWRPGYIQSTDNGGFTGGLGFFVNGAGIANRFGSIEVIRVVNGRVGIGTPTPGESLHVVGNIVASGTITPNSDRNAKTDLKSVDSAAILERVARLPIQRWRFKTEAENVKHLGPMAQDFHAAFGLGAHETAIATVDADGVALAAIQGLNQKLEEKSEEIRTLQERLSKLEELVDRLAPK